MPRHTAFPELPDHILQVSNYKRGQSIPEITEKVKRFYSIGEAPSEKTVYRTCIKLVIENKMYKDDSGWKSHKDNKPTLKRFINAVPSDLLWYELLECLYIMADNPLDNAQEVKLVVRDRLLPTLNRLRMIIDLVDKILESPETVAFAAASEKERIHKRVKEVMSNVQEKQYDIEHFWHNTDTFGEYVIMTRDKENG